MGNPNKNPGNPNKNPVKPNQTINQQIQTKIQ
jgi:hypothetical protein